MRNYLLNLFLSINVHVDSKGNLTEFQFKKMIIFNLTNILDLSNNAITFIKVSSSK